MALADKFPGKSGKKSPKEKPAKPKGKKAKSAASSSRQTPNILPATGIAAALFLVIFTAIYYLNIFAPETKSREINLQAASELAAGQLRNFLFEQQQLAKKLAEQPQVIQALSTQATRKAVESSISLGLPAQGSVQIFSTTQASEGLPEAGFAINDLARRSISGAATKPEAARMNNAWKVISASPIKKGDSIAGAVVVSTPILPLQKTLQLITANGSGVQVSQSGTQQAVIVVGSPTSSPVTVTVPGYDWSVQYSAPAYDIMQSLWWTLVLALLITTGVVYALLRSVSSVSNKPVTADISLLEGLLRDIASGRQPQSGGFNEPAFQPVAQLAIELFGRKASPVSDVPPPKPKAVQVEDELLVSEEPEKEIEEQPEQQKPQPAVAQKQPEPTVEENFDSPLFNDIDDDAFANLDSLDDLEDITETADTGTAVTQTPDIPASIFRAYDIRGEVGVTLQPEYASLIGQAVASEALARGEKSLIVANDGRLSSPELREKLVEGILSTGCNVVSIGTVPTPVLYFATHELESSSGVMITGSHNPASYNGFKIVIAGETLAEEEIQNLYQRIQSQGFAQGKGHASSVDITPIYQQRILDDVVLASPLKIVIDCGNGVAGNTAPQLFEQLGCDVVQLYCDIDGNFPNHHPDPGQPANISALIETVKKENADIGIAFDGDGDRVGLVTNAGTIIYPDKLLMLLAKDVVSRNPGADIIFDVKCTRRLNALISGYGGRPVMWKSGHSLIKRKMRETGALLAGEMSGHIFFKERWYGFDDGIYSAARIAEVLATEGRDAETVFNSFPATVSTPEISVTVGDDNKFGLMQKISAKAQFGEASINTIDGVRVDYPWGWGLVRASNTTPALVFRFEADNDENLGKVQRTFREQIMQIEPRLTLPF